MHNLPADVVEKWEQVLGTIDRDSVPLSCVKKVIFKLRGNRTRSINLQKLRENSLNLEEIELVVTRKMFDLQDEIVNIDFVIDVRGVAEHIQPVTDQLLKGLQ